MTCPSDEKLVGYIEKFVNEHIWEDVDEHIKVCAKCKDEVGKLGDLRKELLASNHCNANREQVKRRVMQRICTQGKRRLLSNRTKKELFEKYQNIARLIRSNKPDVANKGLCELVKCESHYGEDFYIFLLWLLAISRIARHKIEDYIQLMKKSRRWSIVYCNQRDSISRADALSWLEDHSTQVSELVASPHRSICIASVDDARAVPRKRFESCLISLDNKVHIIVCSGNLTGYERTRRICHELLHLVTAESTEDRGHSYAPKQVDDENNKQFIRSKPMEQINQNKQVNDRPHEGPSVALFALDQSHVEPEDKEILANWVTHELPLSSGGGIIVDAGTSCREVWRQIIGQIEMKKCLHMTVYTNSLLVLEDWLKNVDNPHVSGTCVELYGSRLDAHRLAFYGSEYNRGDVREKIMSQGFQPMHVYIGTSGIRFDDKGRILFGYHGGGAERVVKELLFQRPTEKRIILASPSKIDFTSGSSFDLLKVKNLNTAPIYLVTTNAPENRPALKKKYKKAIEGFTSPAMEKAIRAHEGLEFHWIIIDQNDSGLPKMEKHLVVPKGADRTLELY